MLNKSAAISLFPLAGSNIELSLLTEQDVSEEYVAWLNNPEVVKYSNQRFRCHTIESCHQYLGSIKQSDALFIAIRDRHSQIMIGTMTAYFNRYHQTADIGIMIGNSNYRGKGIGQEAWSLMLNCLLSQVGVRKVTGGTLSCNQGMVSIMKKLGMQADGVRVAQEMIDGQAYDIVHFASFRSNDGK